MVLAANGGGEVGNWEGTVSESPLSFPRWGEAHPKFREAALEGAMLRLGLGDSAAFRGFAAEIRRRTFEWHVWPSFAGP